jgi:hypothetical protein
MGYFPCPRDRASFPGQGDEETSGSAGIQLTRGLIERRFSGNRDSFQEWVIHGDLDLIPDGKGLTEHSLKKKKSKLIAIMTGLSQIRWFGLGWSVSSDKEGSGKAHPVGARNR